MDRYAEMISQLALVHSSDLIRKFYIKSQHITKKQPHLSTFDRQQMLQMANSPMEHDQPPKVNVQIKPISTQWYDPIKLD